MRRQPELLPVHYVEHEVSACLKEQLAQGKLSHTVFPTRKSSLGPFGRLYQILSPTDLTAHPTGGVRQEDFFAALSD